MITATFCHLRCSIYHSPRVTFCLQTQPSSSVGARDVIRPVDQSLSTASRDEMQRATRSTEHGRDGYYNRKSTAAAGDRQRTHTPMYRYVTGTVVDVLETEGGGSVHRQTLSACNHEDWTTEKQCQSAV